MPLKRRPTVLATGKAQGGTAGGRWFLISHATDDNSPVRCSELLELKLRATARDKLLRPIEGVKRRPVGATQQANLPAGQQLVPGGDQDWTDFIAVITSSYTLANSGDPDRRDVEPTAPVGEFALAIKLLQSAQEPAANGKAAGKPAAHHADASAQLLWAAVVEQGDWRDLRAAGGTLGEVRVLKVLLNDRTKQPFPPLPPGQVLTPQELDERIRLETLATTPRKTLDAHLSAAVTQLMYAGLPTTGPAL